MAQSQTSPTPTRPKIRADEFKATHVKKIPLLGPTALGFSMMEEVSSHLCSPAYVRQSDDTDENGHLLLQKMLFTQTTLHGLSSKLPAVTAKDLFKAKATQHGA